MLCASGINPNMTIFFELTTDRTNCTVFPNPVVITQRCICKRIVIATNADLIPLFFCATVDNTCQAITARERLISNTGHTVRDGHAGQAVAAKKCIPANTGYTVWDANAGQITTHIERKAANAGHAIRDGNTGQAGTVFERTIANTGHAGRDGNASEAAAVPKRETANAGHGFSVVGERNRQTSTG